MSRDWQVVLELQDLMLPPTRDDVEMAYRRLARLRHPDLGGTADAMAELSRAREEAYAWLAEPVVCQSCGGKGHTLVGGGFSPMRLRCAACNGAGTVNRGE